MLRYDRCSARRTCRNNNMSDAYLMEEIDRIKGETNRLRDMLEERNGQIDQIEETIERCSVDSNALVARITREIDKLQERMEEMEDALTDSMETNNRSIAQGIQTASGPIEERCQRLREETLQGFENIRRTIQDSTEKVDETREAVAGIQEKLEDKAEKKAILALHNKLSTVFAIGVADFIGTIMTLIILCYLIFSIAG